MELSGSFDEVRKMLCLPEDYAKLRLLLEQVLDDGTGEVQGEKRIWPIRAALYREIAAAIDYKYDSERAMKIMSYDIVVRFPSKKLADEFCGQMSDGFGEGYCDFSFWRLKEGTDGKKKEDFEKVTTAEGEIPAGTRVFFVKSIFLP